MYEYTVSKSANIAAFDRQCNVVEKSCVDYKKESIEDVDDSLVNIYTFSDNEIVISLDYDVDAVHVKSKLPIDELIIQER